MTFLNPVILAAGLAAIAIPIAIHLLMRRRRKPTPWAAMRFLMEAIRRRRRRLQLERLLLLAVRCLLVAVIALALGRPTLRGLAGDSPFGSSAITLAIVIDDSIAAGAPDGDGTTALDRHRAMAVELLESLRTDRGDRAILVPLSGPLATEADLPETSALTPTSDLSTISQFLEDLAPTSAAADTAGAMALVGDRLAAAARDETDGGRWVVAVLADGVAGVFPEASAAPGTTTENGGRGPRVSVLLSDPMLSSTGPRGDVGIAALTPVRPVLVVGQGEAVAVSAPARVRIGRSGAGLDTEATVGVRLRFVDDGGPGPWSTAAARLRPGERTASVVLDAQVVGRPRGLAYLEAEIEQRDAQGGVPGNDSVVAAVTLRRQLSIAIIDAVDTMSSRTGGLDPDNPAAWLRVALAPEAMGEDDPLADIAAVTLDPSVVDTPRLARVDAAFVLAPSKMRAGGWQALASFARSGGLVVVFPDPASSLAPWADRFTEALGVPWTIGPEALDHDLPLGITRATGDDQLGLLRLIEGELESLLRPVTVSKSLPLTTESGSESRSLLTMVNGAPAALVSRPGSTSGDGLVIVFAVPLATSWTDLPARPVVVPLVQELARSGVGLAIGSRFSNAGARPPAPNAAVQLRPGWNMAAGSSIAPVGIGDEGRSLRPLRRAGPWLALDGAGRPVGVVAVAPDHRGAARETTARERMRESVSNALGIELTDDESLVWLDRPGGATDGTTAPAQAMARTEPNLALGAILLGVALALAMLEVVLARLFSHAQVPGAAGVNAPRVATREAA